MSDDFSSPRPFTVSIPDEDVQRMARLVADTRLPTTPPIPGASWDYGVDLAWLTQLRQTWIDDFEWKDVEREMNTYSQFTVLIESVNVHFVHVKSACADATPIILIHGWPGKHALFDHDCLTHAHRYYRQAHFGSITAWSSCSPTLPPRPPPSTL